jgi:hypothetical protein
MGETTQKNEEWILGYLVLGSLPNIYQHILILVKIG